MPVYFLRCGEHTPHPNGHQTPATTISNATQTPHTKPASDAARGEGG